METFTRKLPITHGPKEEILEVHRDPRVMMESLLTSTLQLGPGGSELQIQVFLQEVHRETKVTKVTKETLALLLN